MKTNDFRESRLMEATNKQNGSEKQKIFLEYQTKCKNFSGVFQFRYNSKVMMVVSVSLNKTEIKIQDLKNALPLSQTEGQLKISDYFN